MMIAQQCIPMLIDWDRICSEADHPDFDYLRTHPLPINIARELRNIYNEYN